MLLQRLFCLKPFPHWMHMLLARAGSECPKPMSVGRLTGKVLQTKDSAAEHLLWISPTLFSEIRGSETWGFMTARTSAKWVTCPGRWQSRTSEILLIKLNPFPIMMIQGSDQLRVGEELRTHTARILGEQVWPGTMNFGWICSPWLFRASQRAERIWMCVFCDRGRMRERERERKGRQNLRGPRS